MDEGLLTYIPERGVGTIPCFLPRSGLFHWQEHRCRRNGLPCGTPKSEKSALTTTNQAEGKGMLRESHLVRFISGPNVAAREPARFLPLGSQCG